MNELTEWEVRHREAMAENIGVFATDEHIQTEADEFPLAPTYTLPDGRVICLDFNVHMATERGVTVNCYMYHYDDISLIPSGQSAIRDEANLYNIFVPLNVIMEHCDLSQVIEETTTTYKMKEEK